LHPQNNRAILNRYNQIDSFFQDIRIITLKGLALSLFSSIIVFVRSDMSWNAGRYFLFIRSDSDEGPLAPLLHATDEAFINKRTALNGSRTNNDI
jgi:hypothetical protein